MLEKTGVPTQEDLQKIMPPGDRLKKGPVCIVECFQEIPCNPCVSACPKGAIKVEPTINDLPIVDFELCTGCGVCVFQCPGLAIFIVDLSKEDFDFVSVPYEFLPLPEEGEEVMGLNREGEEICKAKVARVLSGEHQDRTAVVTLQVPKGMGMEVRHFRCLRGS